MSAPAAFGFNPSPFNMPGPLVFPDPTQAAAAAAATSAAADAATAAASRPRTRTQLSKQAQSMAAVDAQRAAAAAAATAAQTAGASTSTYFTAAPATPAAAQPASSPAAAAVEYPQGPPDTRRLLAFLLRQDYGCHGPLLASSGASLTGAAAQSARHFQSLRTAEAERRASMSGAVAAARQPGGQPSQVAPLPDAPFPLLRPPMEGAAGSAGAADSSAAPPMERLEFFSALHAFRFEQTQQMSLSTLLEYYTSIWSDVVQWYVGVVHKVTAVAGASLEKQWGLPAPTAVDLLAALHSLFGKHQFVLVHPAAPTTVHPAARRLLASPRDLWAAADAPPTAGAGPWPYRPLTEAETFQTQHLAAYLHPTNAIVDTLAQAPGFQPWLQRRLQEQATNPAYKVVDKPKPKAVTTNALAAAHLASMPTLAAVAAPVAAPAPISAPTPAKSATTPVLAPSHSPLVASSRSPYLAPSSAAIASMLQRNSAAHGVATPPLLASSLPPQHVAVVQPQPQISSMPPAAPSSGAARAAAAAATPSTSRAAAAASTTPAATPVTRSAAPATPAPAATPAASAAAPSSAAASSAPRSLSRPRQPLQASLSAEWVPELRAWLQRTYEPIPASVMAAAGSWSVDAAESTAQNDVSSMFMLDTTGVIEGEAAAAAAAGPAEAAPATSAASAPTYGELQLHAPTSRALWKEFAASMNWAGLKRPKHFGNLVDEVARQVWGPLKHLEGSFLFGSSTLKLQRKAEGADSGTTSSSPAPSPRVKPAVPAAAAAALAAVPSSAPSSSIAAATAAAAVAATATAASAAMLLDDMPPLETPLGEPVPASSFETSTDSAIKPEQTQLAAPASADMGAAAASASAAAAGVVRPTFRFGGATIEYVPTAGLEPPSEHNPFGMPEWHNDSARKLASDPGVTRELIARHAALCYAPYAFSSGSSSSNLTVDRLQSIFNADTDKRCRCSRAEFLEFMAEAAQRLGAPQQSGEGSLLPGYRRRNGFGEKLKASKAALRASMPPSSSSGGGSAKANARLVLPPSTWRDLPPVLLAPTESNPLGLTPGAPSGTPNRSLSEDVVVELLCRWLRVAYEAKGQTSVNTLYTHLCRDLPGGFGAPPRKDRFKDLLPRALSAVFPALGHILNSNVLVRRRVDAPCVTSRLASEGEVAEALQAIRLERKRGFETRNGGPAPLPEPLVVDLDDADATVADDQAPQQPRAKKRKTSRSDADKDSAAAATEGVADASAGASAEAGADAAEEEESAEALSARKVAAMAKVGSRISKTGATIALLVEEESSLTLQLQAVQARLARKREKLKRLVAEEAELDKAPLQKHAPAAAAAAATADKEKHAPTTTKSKKHKAASPATGPVPARTAPEAAEMPPAARTPSHAPVPVPVLAPMPELQVLPELEAGPAAAVAAEPAAVGSAADESAATAADAPSTVDPAAEPQTADLSSQPMPMDLDDSMDSAELPIPELPPQEMAGEADDAHMAEEGAAGGDARAAEAVPEAASEAPADAQAGAPVDAAPASADAAAAAAAAPIPTASPSSGAMTPFASPEPASGSAAAAAPQAPVSIRIGQPSDAASLSSFARTAFSAAFAAHNTEADMAAYLSSAYTPSIQERELRDPGVTYFLAERDGALVGFAMVRDEPAPDCVSDRRAPEIQRIYGVGVGAALMRRCLSHAAWLGRSTTWLGVWEKNVRANRFYQRYGFKDVGSHDFLLGSDPQTDRILERRVDPLVPQESPPTGSSGAASAAAADSSDLYTPLPATEDARARVLDAFKNAPRTELEREHGCSTLQVACALRLPQAEVETHAAALAADGLLVTTRDAQHYR